MERILIRILMKKDLGYGRKPKAETLYRKAAPHLRLFWCRIKTASPLDDSIASPGGNPKEAESDVELPNLDNAVES
jgi:hypothetical protein